MNNGKTTPTKENHLLEIVAERLGCTYLSDLKQPQYRERARKELRDGNFDRINVDEYRDASWYLAPPLKTMLYGTAEDKALFESWTNDDGFSRDTALYHNYDTYLEALCSDKYDIAVCMVDGEPGFEAVKAAYTHRPNIPMMWFPKSSKHTCDTFGYGCILCGMQSRITPEDMEWTFKQCWKKIMQVRRDKAGQN